jgi:hypothetical protein
MVFVFYVIFLGFCIIFGVLWVGKFGFLKVLVNFGVGNRFFGIL